MHKLRFLGTIPGISFLLSLALGAWMYYTLWWYFYYDLLLVQILLETEGGIPILIGVAVLMLQWVFVTWLSKSLFKRLLMHSLTMLLLGVALYFWWNHLVLDTLISVTSKLYIRQISIEQALKLAAVCAVLPLPSLLLSGAGKWIPNKYHAQLWLTLAWVVLCAGLAVPVNMFWWQWAAPIQPLADRIFIPPGDVYLGAVQLFMGANGIRFLMLCFGFGLR